MRLKPRFGEVYNVPTLDTATYILVDEYGNEAVGVVVDEKQTFTATANDIREGTVAATCDGVTLGTKIIPSYHTSEGIKAVPVGSSFSLKIFNYDYTKLQALICVYNTSLSDSVATDKVCINENVYEVNKIDVLSIISKNHNNGTIEFGIKNTSDKPYLIRYFTYKEIY